MRITTVLSIAILFCSSARADRQQVQRMEKLEIADYKTFIGDKAPLKKNQKATLKIKLMPQPLSSFSVVSAYNATGYGKYDAVAIYASDYEISDKWVTTDEGKRADNIMPYRFTSPFTALIGPDGDKYQCDLKEFVLVDEYEKFRASGKNKFRSAQPKQ